MDVVLAVVLIAVLLAAIAGFVVVRRRREPRGGVAVAGRPPVPTAPARADGLAARVRSIFAGSTAGDDEWARLEDVLLRADVGPETASRIVGGYTIKDGVIIQDGTGAYSFETDWDELINREDLSSYLRSLYDSSNLPSVGARDWYRLPAGQRVVRASYHSMRSTWE